MTTITEDKHAIHAAAREGRLAAVESLLSANPKLSSTRDPDDRLAIHWATSHNHPDIVRLLASQKSFDPDAVDASGWTCLMMASSLKDDAGLDLVKFLLGKEADAKLASGTGGTALHFAVSKSNLEVAKTLLAAGASARAKDKRGQLPLHRAAAVGSVTIVKLLLQNRTPVNASDSDGMTALHHAISEGHGDVAGELLKVEGLEVDKRDGEGRTALECAPDAKVREFVVAAGRREGFEFEGVDG
ncbi:putative 26S proteasome regulatory subunit p28 [Cyphellophora attinorum]|uniref:Putative 26S proteasome regulatory subunit p28 n=1 Tax=Cyphellophora attinorum TaxID=1664694 RepID=A0A0N1HNG0_9EURO|nr:putative 26S proteasome regulatory subunit p28 [Phialophora attinorum]KPI39043.1 putative 26S proteasome regulatory subunit p28 [Phialophora attinorum]